MPRRERPLKITRSEHWMRVAANERTGALNALILKAFKWDKGERITWLSPIESDHFAEYYDQAFLERLGVTNLKVPLGNFWPRSGPRWDGLARTNSGKIILVEAKAYIEEAVDFCSKAGPKAMPQIATALAEAKQAFGASRDAPWEAPYYQYANRLAHLYFLRHQNELDVYLVFLYFADAPDVPSPCSASEWHGAERLLKKSLGLGSHPFQSRLATIIWRVPQMLSHRL